MYLKKPYLGDYPITSFYGNRIHPITKKNKKHNGIDIALPEFTQILAPIKGICYVHEDKFSGKYIVLSATTEQNTKIQLVFCHLSKFLIKDNQSVLMNEAIALSGNTGASTGAHLHLGIKVYDYNKEEFIFVNPLNYIKV